MKNIYKTSKLRSHTLFIYNYIADPLTHILICFSTKNISYKQCLIYISIYYLILLLFRHISKFIRSVFYVYIYVLEVVCVHIFYVNSLFILGIQNLFRCRFYIIFYNLFVHYAQNFYLRNIFSTFSLSLNFIVRCNNCLSLFIKAFRNKEHFVFKL